MHPILFRIGGFSIHTYGVCVALGVLLALLLMKRSTSREGLSPEETADLVLWTTVASFAGARLFYVVQNFDYYRENPLEIFAIWQGGVVFYGGVLGGLAFLGAYSAVQRKSFLKITDFFSPYLLLAHGVGRIGCFLNGCCYGKFTTLPWAVSFPSVPETVHPVQLYEAAFNFSVFPLLIWCHRRKLFEGQTTFLYFLIYGLGRFFLEQFRGDNFDVAGGLTLPQMVSLFLVLAGISGLVFLSIRHGIRKKGI
ncbi:MAG TPA: prolipoprotein diacylglyceryl transferase [Candidatus Omnitrophota bacterium]|nr:prolipoprotein diacylglyceryl transferase [Candidatus Omnitrophota bacterium]